VAVAQRLEPAEELLAGKLLAVALVAVIEAVAAAQVAAIGEIDDRAVVFALQRSVRSTIAPWYSRGSRSLNMGPVPSRRSLSRIWGASLSR
jgi:hypothetical protein